MHPRNSASAERIVEAAAHLFAFHGYRGTSTRKIARLAKVSENTLFRHFHHKEDIFWSALRHCAATLRPCWDLFGGIEPGDAPEIVLPRLLGLLAETVSCRPEVIRLVAVAFLEMQGKAEVHCRDVISRVFSEISQYLASSVQKGTVKEVDPTLLVASLTAMVLVHPQLAKLTKENSEKSGVADSREIVRAYSRFWLDVLTPRLPASSIAIPLTYESASG